MERITAEINVVKFDELFESLNEENKTEEVRDQLWRYYQIEKGNLFDYALSSKLPQIVLGVFRKCGHQYIADFCVNDLGIQKSESYNFHFQNTSQWKYAGCILVQDGKVSTHH